MNLTQSMLVLGLCTAALASAAERPPNIIVILADDQGYADVSYNPHHPKEVATPNIDKLARSGVICTSGYASGYVCSPTRAGIMTGRYQQRFGIYTPGEGGTGGTLGAKFIPNYLKEKGYVSAAFGKWHLGLAMEYNPINRGFDEFYGFMGRGAHDYYKLGLPDLNEKKANPLYRGKTPIADKGYLTTRLTEEAVDFITRRKDKPFFAYVAFNAVHSPAQAPPEDIKRYNTGDETRNILMAMLYHLDLGVGRIVDTLKKTGVYDNTLIIYLSDNGGAKGMNACNAPLRGCKHMCYEGGVRVPFFASWPGRIKPGTTCDVPVFSLDILPTALAAAGIDLPADAKVDGKNILPVLTGQKKTNHDHLCWNGGEGKWAILRGDWKIVSEKGKVELYNVANDIAESKDLAKTNPEKVQELTKLYNAWLDEMPEPNGAPRSYKTYDPAKNAGGKKKRKKKNKKEK